MADLVFAVSTVSTSDPVSGLRVRLSAGEAWWASDPFVKARPDLFTNVPPVVRGARGVKAVPVEKVAVSEVEQATAVPGVKRSVKKS